MPKIFDYKGKREIIVSINQDPNAEPGVVDDRTGKGMMPGSRKPAGAFRRRPAGFLNFYDLGQILVDGQWKDSVVNVGPDVIVDPNFNEILERYNPIYTTPPMSLSDWEDVHEIFFAVPFEDWKEKFRKVDYEEAYKYGIGVVEGPDFDDYRDVDAANENWTSRGYKNLPKIDVETTNLALSFDTSDTATFKITEAYDYAAEEVSIPVNGPIDVFLIPWLASFYAERHYEYGGDPFIVKIKTFLGGYSVISRELFLQNNITSYGYRWRYYLENPIPILLERPFFQTRFGTNYASTNPDFSRIAIGQPGYISSYLRDLVRDYLPRFGGTSTTLTYIDGEANDFELDTGPAYIADLDPSMFFEIFLQFGSVNIQPEGMLRGIIMKGAKRYYIWNKVEIPYFGSWENGPEPPSLPYLRYDFDYE